MKEYILRFDELTGAIVGLEEIDEDPIGELEAVVVAMVKSLNERLMQAEQKLQEAYRRIEQLEARPIATINQHYSYPAPDTSAPRTSPFDPVFTCKI
jgi:hypothetical protein